MAERKIAWVLGGGSGIGAEVVKGLIGRGWTVAISGRRVEPLEALRASHGAIPYPLDVTDREAVDRTVAQIAGDHGKIDLMLFSVAAWENNKPGVYEYEAFKKTIDTNLLGAMAVIEPTLRQMRQQGFGEIALVASVAGYFGLPRASSYSSGKAAMIALAETMKAELAADNITVRLICPGFVKTDLTAKNDFEMPFLMEADEAGRRIVSGLLDSTRFEIAFPRRFVLILKTIKLLPYPLFFAVMKRLAGR